MRFTLDGPIQQTIFIPTTQRPGGAITLFVHSGQNPLALASGVTSVVHALEPEATVAIRTLDEVVGRTIARPRAISVLVGVFALVALILAAVGVYGVMAYLVKKRTQEIRVRMALGASSASVFRMILWSGVAVGPDWHRHRTPRLSSAHAPARRTALQR
jgi:putative ABC transport system permease protein